MKKLLTFVAIIIASHLSLAQDHAVGLSYGPVFGGGANDFAEIAGASSYHYRKGSQFNLHYSLQFSDNLALVSGLQFQQILMQSQNGSTTGELQSWDFQVDNLNIPILLNVAFLKYLFVEGGPVLNFQSNEKDPYGIEDQSGLGFSVGLGARYEMGKFNVFIKSQSQVHAAVPFNREKYHDRLFANSLCFGVFYQL